YPSHYWYPESHATGHYANTYPSGSDVPPQYNQQVIQMAMVSTAQRRTNTRLVVSTRPTRFTVLTLRDRLQGRTPTRPVLPSRAVGRLGSPTPNTSIITILVHSVKGEGGHAMPANPPYPTGQPLHPSPQSDGWTHSGAYAPPQQQWQPGQQPPQNHYGNPVRPPHPPAWPGTGTGAPPPYQPKDQQHQRAPQVGPKPRPTPSLNAPSGKPAEICSPPQLYNKSGRGDPNPSQAEPPPQAPAPVPARAGPQPLSDNPSLAKVQLVMARMMLLQEDVDEFVGRKSDKSYRVLEELLTKELLLLDSVETQDRRPSGKPERTLCRRSRPYWTSWRRKPSELDLFTGLSILDDMSSYLRT
ncbi:hypothetical protein F7725_012850, partial [Dissostichus mawsoni]